MASPAFREVFAYGGHVNWFPGHMAKATRLIQERLRAVDIVVEVRDARVPFSSQNAAIEPMLATRRRLVVFNKADLANPNLQRGLTKHCKSLGMDAMFTVANKRGSISKLVATVLKEADAASPFKVAGSTMLVVGIPNVGKSSLINAVREKALKTTKRSRGAKQGAKPGLTRSVSSLLVSDSPRLYLIDTPGVMMPNVSDMDVGLRLAVTGALRDATVPEVVMADYLLFRLNQLGARRFVEALGLPGPMDDIQAVFRHVSSVIHPGRDRVDEDATARHIISLYRSGGLGRYTLDDVS